MNQTLHQLAYRNIHKYKKHYLFVGIMIFVVSMIFMSVVLGYSNYYRVKKHYNQEHYGTWYSYMDLTGYSEKIFDDILEYVQNSKLHYGLWYDQGIQNEYLIGSMDKQLYDMCRIKLKEGKYPAKDNEIAISHQIDAYKLHDTVSLQFDGKTKEYTVVGIVEKSQDLFPDIYTFQKISDKCYLVLDTVLGHGTPETEYSFYIDPYDESTGIVYKPVFNPFGYSSGSFGVFQQASTQLLLLLEALALIIVVLITITSTSLKRRSNEFALLRGIGMTTRQLFVMVFYENLFTIFMSLFMGALLSFGIVYVMMLYFQSVYHYFYYQVDIPTFLFYFVVLLAILIVATIFPIFNSAKYSLSGTFDAKRFQYIQVRYKKLKKQTLYRLALRELKVSKKITFFMIGCFVFISTVFIFLNVDFESANADYIQSFEYYVNYTLDKENLEEAYQIPDISIYHQKKVNSQIDYKSHKGIDSYTTLISIDNIMDIDDIENSISGSMPKNENEILIRSDYEVVINHYISEYHTHVESLEPIQIGDVITLDGIDLKVVGKLDTINPFLDMIVMPETFNKFTDKDIYFIYDVFKTRKNQAEYINKLVQYPFIEREKIYGVDMGEQGVQSQQFEFDNSLFVLPICAFLVFSYFLNKSDMMNHIRDYRLYSLIGMTHNELLRKQFLKAMHISIITFIILVFFSLMNSISYGGTYVPIKIIIVESIVVLICSSIIYCLPLYSIIKSNFVGSLNGDE